MNRRTGWFRWGSRTFEVVTRNIMFFEGTAVIEEGEREAFLPR